MTNTTPMVEIENISKTFVVEDRKPVKALQNVTNHVEKGEVLVVIGPSGSGKSTLPNFDSPERRSGRARRRS